MENRYCAGCNGLVEPDVPTWLSRCKKCVEFLQGSRIAAVYRTCTVCRKNNIPPTVSPEITKCASCQARSNTHRYCCACGSLSVPKGAEWYKDRCNDCFKTKAEIKDEYVMSVYKICETCSKPRILKQETWRTSCVPCYKELMSKCKDCSRKLTGNTEDRLCDECREVAETMMRECSLCFELSIPYTAKDNVNKCKTCEDKEPKRECMVCGQNTILLSDPEWSKKCTPCYIKEKAGSKSTTPTAPKRKCISCGEMKISATSPSTWKKCYTCSTKK